MLTAPTLILSLATHGTPLTRAFYAKRLRPFSAGYTLDARAEDGDQVLVGINHPGSTPGKKLYRIIGRGQADNASPFAYDLTALGAIPTGANALPTTNAAGILPSTGYANCLGVIRNDTARQALSAIGPVERIGTGGANVTRQFFRVDTATTITVAFGYAGGVYQDLPKGWALDLIVPDAADITAGTVNLVGDTQIQLAAKDFWVNGDGTATKIVNLTIAHQ